MKKIKFNTTVARGYYNEMFGEPLDMETIEIAKQMTDEEFQAACNQFDDDGEYTNSPLSAGQWDCIDAARIDQ